MTLIQSQMNEAQIIREFNKQAKEIGLTIDCLSSGNINSEIVILSEAPGETEASLKMPMVGGAGKTLWTMLEKVGIRRKDCYITNVIKRQLSLSTKTNVRAAITQAEVDHWEGLLDWELDQLPNVKYIICLGNYALHALTGDKGINNWRGSVMPCTFGNRKRTAQCIFSYNPAMVLRDISLETIFLFDMHKVRMVLDGKYKTHPITHLINPSPTEAIRYLDKMQDEKEPISFDIETMANETACIGFANQAHEGMCINFRDATTNIFSVYDERRLRRRIQRLLIDPNVKLVAQNGNFDSYWLWYKDRIRVAPLYFDTLLAHHTLYPRMPHSLGFLTAQYTTHPYYKDDGKSWREGGNIDQFWEYNVKDCCITHKVFQRLLVELNQQNLDEFFFNHVMRLQPELIKMTVGGVLSDVELKEKLAADLEVELQHKLEHFHSVVHAATGDELYSPNPKSPKQLAELLFGRLKLRGRGVSTDKTNRERIRNDPRTSAEAVKVIDALDDYVKDQKFYSTYATTTIDNDGRIRCEYKQFGTQSAPGRLSSTQVMWGSGMNLQNQPQRAYPIFIADKGYQFSYFDLRQAEAKVVAHAWNVTKLKENFKRAETEEGFDVHRLNAAAIFNLPYDQIPSFDRHILGKTTEDPLLDNEVTTRYLGKRCVHGLNYRMQAPKLAEVCKIPITQAEAAFFAYHRAFPEIQQAWSRTIKTIYEEKQLFSLMGRRMIFMGRIDESMLDSVIAFVPQATIGDKVSSVIYECHSHPEWPTQYARMSLNIHDALIALHLEDDHVRETVQGIMRECAEKPIIIRGQPVTIFTDFKQSYADDTGVHRWSTLKDV